MTVEIVKAESFEEIPKLFQELELRMGKKYNSNFQINTLDTCTKAAIKELCEILDEIFNNIWKKV
jgi:hypothetical protein